MKLYNEKNISTLSFLLPLFSRNQKLLILFSVAVAIGFASGLIEKATARGSVLDQAGLAGPNISSLTLTNEDLSQAHGGNIKTLCSEKELYILVVKQQNEQEIQEFCKEFESKGKFFLNYFPPCEVSEGHYEIPSEVAAERGIDFPVKPTGKNNCLYDALSSLLNAQGDNTSAEELRKIAEKTSLINIVYNILNSLVELLKITRTKTIYYKAKSALTVGGSLPNGPIIVDEVKNVPKEVEMIAKANIEKIIGFRVYQATEAEHLKFYPLNYKESQVEVLKAYYAPYINGNQCGTWEGLQSIGVRVPLRNPKHYYVLTQEFSGCSFIIAVGPNDMEIFHDSHPEKDWQRKGEKLKAEGRTVIRFDEKDLSKLGHQGTIQKFYEIFIREETKEVYVYHMMLIYDHEWHFIQQQLKYEPGSPTRTPVITRITRLSDILQSGQKMDL